MVLDVSAKYTSRGMSVVLEWNGTDLPDELKRLPAGRYVVELIEEASELSQNEEDGLLRALESVRSGQGVELAAARARVLAVGKR